MIDRNHPAVNRAAQIINNHGWTCTAHEPEPFGSCRECKDSQLHTATAAIGAALPHLTAALPHLTAEDIRDIPVGRALKAEGWDEGFHEGVYAANLFSSGQTPNPYRETTHE